jgi:BON domain
MRTTLLAASLVLAVLIPATHVAAQSDQDKSIALEIGNQLKTSGQLRDYRIGVKYKDGIAALSGTVTSQQQLSTAVHLTQQMRGVDQVVNNLKVAAPNPGLTKPAAQLAARASYTGPGPQNAMASRTSYQQQGPGPQQGFNPQQGMGPMGQQGMGPQSMGQAPMYRQNMGGPGMNPNMAGQNMGPMGPRPQQRPMNSQGRGNNMPRPMGRPQVQQAMMAQQQQQQMQAMQAGCNCGPGGMGGGMDMGGGMGGPPMGYSPGGQGGAVNNDDAQMPGYAWPSYASYPNYAAVSYPQQYSPSAWPYIGPFYPYPQVPLGWRKVCLEWDDGWWFLDFSDCGSNH